MNVHNSIISNNQKLETMSVKRGGGPGEDDRMQRPWNVSSEECGVAGAVSDQESSGK